MNALVDKLHTPDVSSAFGIATLRYEVNILPVAAPAGAEVIGCMVGVLHQLYAIGAHGVDVGIPISEIACLYLRTSHKEQTASSGLSMGVVKLRSGSVTMHSSTPVA